MDENIHILVIYFIYFVAAVKFRLNSKTIQLREFFVSRKSAGGDRAESRNPFPVLAMSIAKC